MFAKIGTGELIVILIVALLVVGPAKLPALAKSVGQAINATKAYMREMVGDVADDVADIQKDISSLEKDLKDTETYINSPESTNKNNKAHEVMSDEASASACNNTEALSPNGTKPQFNN